MYVFVNHESVSLYIFLKNNVTHSFKMRGLNLKKELIKFIVNQSSIK